MEEAFSTSSWNPTIAANGDGPAGASASVGTPVGEFYSRGFFSPREDPSVEVPAMGGRLAAGAATATRGPASADGKTNGRSRKGSIDENPKAQAELARREAEMRAMFEAKMAEKVAQLERAAEEKIKQKEMELQRQKEAEVEKLKMNMLDGTGTTPGSVAKKAADMAAAGDDGWSPFSDPAALDEPVAAAADVNGISSLPFDADVGPRSAATVLEGFVAERKDDSSGPAAPADESKRERIMSGSPPTPTFRLDFCDSVSVPSPDEPHSTPSDAAFFSRSSGGPFQPELVSCGESSATAAGMLEPPAEVVVGSSSSLPALAPPAPALPEARPSAAETISSLNDADFPPVGDLHFPEAEYGDEDVVEDAYTDADMQDCLEQQVAALGEYVEGLELELDLPVDGVARRAAGAENPLEAVAETGSETQSAAIIVHLAESESQGADAVVAQTQPSAGHLVTATKKKFIDPDDPPVPYLGVENEDNSGTTTPTGMDGEPSSSISLEPAHPFAASAACAVVALAPDGEQAEDEISSATTTETAACFTGGAAAPSSGAPSCAISSSTSSSADADEEDANDTKNANEKLVEQDENSAQEVEAGSKKAATAVPVPAIAPFTIDEGSDDEDGGDKRKAETEWATVWNEKFPDKRVSPTTGNHDRAFPESGSQEFDFYSYGSTGGHNVSKGMNMYGRETSAGGSWYGPQGQGGSGYGPGAGGAAHQHHAGNKMNGNGKAGTIGSYGYDRTGSYGTNSGSEDGKGTGFGSGSGYYGMQGHSMKGGSATASGSSKGNWTAGGGAGSSGYGSGYNNVDGSYGLASSSKNGGAGSLNDALGWKNTAMKGTGKSSSSSSSFYLQQQIAAYNGAAPGMRMGTGMASSSSSQMQSKGGKPSGAGAGGVTGPMGGAHPNANGACYPAPMAKGAGGAGPGVGHPTNTMMKGPGAPVSGVAPAAPPGAGAGYNLHGTMGGQGMGMGMIQKGQGGPAWAPGAPAAAMVIPAIAPAHLGGLVPHGAVSAAAAAGRVPALNPHAMLQPHPAAGGPLIAGPATATQHFRPHGLGGSSVDLVPVVVPVGAGAGVQSARAAPAPAGVFYGAAMKGTPANGPAQAGLGTKGPAGIPSNSLPLSAAAPAFVPGGKEVKASTASPVNASLATEDPKTAKSPLEQAATAAALNAADRRDVPFELVEFCGQYVGNTDNGESALISCQQTDDLFQTPELQTPELDFRNRLRVGNVVAFQIVKGREKGSVQFKRGSVRSPQKVQLFAGTVGAVVPGTKDTRVVYCIGVKALFASELRASSDLLPKEVEEGEVIAFQVSGSGQKGSEPSIIPGSAKRIAALHL